MPPDIEISGLLPTSIQTSDSSKTWEPPSQRPWIALATCLPGWSMAAEVKTIFEPRPSMKPTPAGIEAGWGPE